MHKPRRFVIICKPNINLCTMSIWVSIHIFNFFLVYLFCSLPNKLLIITHPHTPTHTHPHTHTHVSVSPTVVFVVPVHFLRLSHLDADPGTQRVQRSNAQWNHSPGTTTTTTQRQSKVMLYHERPVWQHLQVCTRVDTRSCTTIIYCARRYRIHKVCFEVFF